MLLATELEQRERAQDERELGLPGASADRCGPGQQPNGVASLDVMRSKRSGLADRPLLALELAIIGCLRACVVEDDRDVSG